MAKAKPKPIHPLAMARALEEINNRAASVIMAAKTASDLAPGLNEAGLRKLIATVHDEAEALRLALWPGDDED